MNLVPRNAVEQKIHAILSFSLHIYHICCYYVLASQRLDNHYPENSWGSFIFLQSMMAARVITTIRQLHRPRQACIVVMTLAGIMGWGASQKYELHPLYGVHGPYGFTGPALTTFGIDEAIDPFGGNVSL